MSASPTLTGTAVFEVLTVGGGYGSTGVTISSVGAISADGAVTFGSTLTTGSTAGFMDTPAVSTHYPITIGSEADTAGGLQITSVSVARWAIVKDNTAETGSNVGADLRIIANDDAGNQLINPVIFARRADGYIGIGTSSLTGKLHIDQSSTTGAAPVILFDQADISEEFIRFIGTAAAATLTQSLVAEADVTTATRAGFVKVYIQDDGNQLTDQAYFVPVYTLA